jgi:hypothetical protein
MATQAEERQRLVSAWVDEAEALADRKMQQSP